MPRKYFFAVLALFFLTVQGFNASLAEDAIPACTQLDEKASDDMAKYSLHGEAEGPVFFSGISCAIQHRNKEFCAMEMVNFDTTAKVYDYNTLEEIDMSKAFFWLDGKNNESPIVAFGSKEDAEKFGTENEGGEILDFSSLTDKSLN
jgi:nitrous oxide reductase accessory protein NosL